MADNKHIINFSKLCCVCGKTIVLTRGYPAAKLAVNFKAELACLNIDIDRDDYSIHPTKLCNTHYFGIYPIKNSACFTNMSFNKICLVHFLHVCIFSLFF